MAAPENIGALQRALLTTPAAPLDPFGEPPFAGRREMIGMARSRIEDAYEAAIDALEGLREQGLLQVDPATGVWTATPTGRAEMERLKAGKTH